MQLHADLTDLLFWLAVGSIAIATVIAGLQVRQTNRMEKIIDMTKTRNEKRKKYLLPRMKHNTLLIKERVETLQNRITLYEKDANENPWENIRTYSTGSIIHIIDFGKAATTDLDRVFDLIDDPVLWDMYHVQNVQGSILPFQYAISINPELDRFQIKGLSNPNLGATNLKELKVLVADRIRILDNTLSSIDAEMPKEERKSTFWRARYSVDQTSQ